MYRSFRNTLIIAMALSCLGLHAQVTVTGAALSPLNITPGSLCQASLLNAQGETDVQLIADLYNSAGEALVEVHTQPFRIGSGLHVIQQQELVFSSIVYAATAQGKFLQAQHQLPSGLFRHCIRVSSSNSETADEFCEDVESVTSTFLNLVFPADKDTIDTKTPLLTWTHSEPFTLLTPGESFRLVLVKLATGQDPEAAVEANVPLFVQQQVFRHEVQYPFSAAALEEGTTYAWQVQKLAAGGQTIIDKTEAWQFTLRKTPMVKSSKYAVLKKQLDAGYTIAYGEKVYFRFDENYNGSQLRCVVYDEQRRTVDLKPLNEALKDPAAAITAKTEGYNRFMLDLEPLKLSKGFYFLEVRNEKNEKYTLKFYVE